MKPIVKGCLVLISCLPQLSCNRASSEGYREAANKLERQRRYTEAIQLLNKAIEDDPDNINAFLDRGVDKSIIQDLHGSIDDYSKALEIDPRNVMALLNRGKSKARLKDFAGAIYDFNAALNFKVFYTPGKIEEEYDVSIAAIRQERGVVYYQSDSLSKAFSDLTFSIDHYYMLPDSYYWRGLIYLKYDMKKEACSDFLNARTLGHPHVQRLIAMYCR